MAEFLIVEKDSFDAIVEKGVICFADTCFLMNRAFLDDFYNSMNMYNRCHRQHFRLRILPACMAELQKKASSRDGITAQRATRVLSIIEKDLEKGQNFLIYDMETGTRHNDANLIAAAVLERVKRPVCIFTQDVELQCDVFATTGFKSCKGHNLSVMSFDYNGRLCSKYFYQAPENKHRVKTNCREEAVA